MLRELAAARGARPVVLALCLVLAAAPALCLWFAAAPAAACNVPVFRYALERWAADLYHVAVFRRGELSPAQSEILDWLKSCAAGRDSFANFVVEEVDLDGDPPAWASALWEVEPGDVLPWVVVHYPRGAPVHVPAWKGPLSAAAAHGLVDSPARRAMAEGLVRGACAVWLVLESGDAQRDEEAVRTLRAALAEVETLIKLPPVDALYWGDDASPDIAFEAFQAHGDAGASGAAPEGQAVAQAEAGGAPPHTRPQFAVVRVARDDPAEAVLRDMLCTSEPDLAALTETMVFPVFGRGRALYALVGKGINARNIEEACAFVTGPCSCQIKAMNPGVDLLMNVDWDSSIVDAQVRAPALPPLAGLHAAADGPSGGDGADHGHALLATILALAAAATALLGAGTAVLLRRRA